jgi:exopolysaccharide production protein ExoY
MIKLLAFILFIITLPLLILIALIIKLNYPGPIFYSQIREGKNGKTFKIWKLRTMVVNSKEILEQMLKDESIAKFWNDNGFLKNDQRITGFAGRFARQFSIDELPQLINVLKGEMSFIGPRPLERFSLEYLTPQKRQYRSSILPGMTGLSQVCNRGASTRHIILYDLIYLKNKSFCLDVNILFKTIFAIIKRTGLKR